MLFLPFILQSDISGEVVKILRKDGGKSVFRRFFASNIVEVSLIMAYQFTILVTEPVGYGDALIAVLPSFPGIKKLQ